jgi:capsid protein
MEGGNFSVARLIYGSEYRIDNVRGLPLISVVLETAKKLERYKEATIGSAEERAKIAYFIEHQVGSDESNPLTRQMAIAAGYDPNGDLPTTDDGEVLANRVAASTNKQVFNMGISQTMKALESKNDLYFKDFYGVNIDLLCASVEMPPNVALSKYDSNYSASRAAIKDWEHTLLVRRDDFSYQFDLFAYEFWLIIEVMRNKISAPGFLAAFMDDNYMALSAYLNARWVGSNVPHIDPLKEVQAERAKLGPAGAALPLTTAEAATEALNGGESDANIEQFAAEVARAKQLGIEVAPEKPPANNAGSGA